MSASEIIKELPKLSEAERRAVFNKLCELAEGDQRWGEIIDDERPLPKLDAFVEKARVYRNQSSDGRGDRLRPDGRRRYGPGLAKWGFQPEWS